MQVKDIKKSKTFFKLNCIYGQYSALSPAQRRLPVMWLRPEPGRLLSPTLDDLRHQSMA